MRLVGFRCHLGHEERRDEKWMAWQFNHAYCAFFIVPGNPQIPAPDLGLECFIQTVIACEDFPRLTLAVDAPCLSSFLNQNRSSLSDKRAAQLADQLQWRVRRRFFVVGIGQA